jgi:hypothetical protein
MTKRREGQENRQTYVTSNLDKFGSCRGCEHTRLKKAVAGSRGNGKTIPLQAWKGLECSRRLRFPDARQSAREGGKIVRPMHRPTLPTGIIPGTHFC